MHFFLWGTFIYIYYITSSAISTLNIINYLRTMSAFIALSTSQRIDIKEIEKKYNEIHIIAASFPRKYFSSIQRSTFYSPFFKKTQLNIRCSIFFSACDTTIYWIIFSVNIHIISYKFTTNSWGGTMHFQNSTPSHMSHYALFGAFMSNRPSLKSSNRLEKNQL